MVGCGVVVVVVAVGGEAGSAGVGGKGAWFTGVEDGVMVAGVEGDGPTGEVEAPVHDYRIT